MKKNYTSPRIDEVVFCLEQNLMIALSGTEKDGSEALVNERRPAGNDWDNIWSE